MSAEVAPIVSVGLPVYNGENYLSDALDSLLAQTFADFELILSDNASTDGTEAICREYAKKDSRIRFFRSETNYGAAWNFNNTFRMARGKYFKWAAHDDLHHPLFLERCVEILEQDASVVLCFARTAVIDSDGKEAGELIYRTDLHAASRKQRFLHFASTEHIVHEIFGLIRADVLRNTPLIGPYLGSDLVLLGKLSLYGPFIQVPERLFLHREHDKRSMLNPQGAANKTQWYDSRKGGRFVMPLWRRLAENARIVIWQPGMKGSEKLGCLVDLIRVANWNRERLSGELVLVFQSLVHRAR
jgi:glycosyltransferase involved in cell wall biosynthesis